MNKEITKEQEEYFMAGAVSVLLTAVQDERIKFTEDDLVVILAKLSKNIKLDFKKEFNADFDFKDLREGRFIPNKKT